MQARHEEYTLDTQGDGDILDVTGHAQKAIDNCGFANGLCTVFVAHSTCAVTTIDDSFRKKYPDVMERFANFLGARPELKTFIHDPGKTGQKNRRLGAILDETKLRRVLAKMLDEKEFLSPHGIRALSRFHAEHPYVFNVGSIEYRVGYVPGESDTGMFGGNSNWRGPIWMPVNALIIRGLLQYYMYYGDEFSVECPTGSGRKMSLYQIAEELSRRLASIFLKGPDGRRPITATYATPENLRPRPEMAPYQLPRPTSSSRPRRETRSFKPARASMTTAAMAAPRPRAGWQPQMTAT